MDIKLSRELKDNERPDYGFITFSKEEEAAKLISEFDWEEYFTTPITVQYARKISSIRKHKSRTQTGGFLEKKRERGRNDYRNNNNNNMNNNMNNKLPYNVGGGSNVGGGYNNNNLNTPQLVN